MNPDPLYVPEDELTPERSEAIWRQIRRAIAGKRNDEWAQGVRLGVVVGRRVGEGRSKRRAKNELLLPILIGFGIAALIGFAVGHADVRAATPRSAQAIPAVSLVIGDASTPGRSGAPLQAQPLVTGSLPVTGTVTSGVPSPWPTIPAVNLPRQRPSIAGTATWYCNFDDRSVVLSPCHHAFPDGPGLDGFAAAGPELRRKLGDWRGRVVLVTSAAGVEIHLRLVDWCACGGDHVIDLYQDAFAFLARRGPVNPATVSW